MGSGLQKMQLTYDRPEDRLVLTFYTQDFCEYRFWITRRMLLALWDILKKLQEAVLKTDAQKREEERKATSQIQHEATQPLASQYGTRMTKRPLGDTPLLLYKVMARPIERGQIFFHFEDPQGKNIEFTADANLLTGLIQLIEKTEPQTEWGLKL